MRRRSWPRPGRIIANASRRGTSAATASALPCRPRPRAIVTVSRSARASRRAKGRPESTGVSRRLRARAATRVERDSLGLIAVPRRALWGAFTERARRTFFLTGLPPHPALVRAYARIKQAAARANARLGLLPLRWAAAIAGAGAPGAGGRRARR